MAAFVHPSHVWLRLFWSAAVVVIYWASACSDEQANGQGRGGAEGWRRAREEKSERSCLQSERGAQSSCKSCNWRGLTVHGSGWIQMTTGIRERGGYEEGAEEDRVAQEVACGCKHGGLWKAGPGACGCICVSMFPVYLCAPVNVLMCFFELAEHTTVLLTWPTGVGGCVCVSEREREKDGRREVWKGGGGPGRSRTMKSVQWFYDGGPR